MAEIFSPLMPRSARVVSVAVMMVPFLMMVSKRMAGPQLKRYAVEVADDILR